MCKKPSKGSSGQKDKPKKSESVKRQVLKLGSIEIGHSNSYETIENTDMGEGYLAICNHLCRQQGTKITKTTEILFEGQLIRIVDEISSISKFDIENKQSKVKKDLQNKTLVSMRTKSQLEVFPKNDFENWSLVGQSLMNILQWYVSQLEESQNLENFHSEICKILEQNAPSCRKIVQKILKNASIKKSLCQFLFEHLKDQFQGQEDIFKRECSAQLIEKFRDFLSSKQPFMKSSLFQFLEKADSLKYDSHKATLKAKPLFPQKKQYKNSSFDSTASKYQSQIKKGRDHRNKQKEEGL